jgi:hypothetical protein
MSGTNDSLIIGCVLVLVFGALFYYLHSRLLYSEKRINVMETILLDFKNASETFFTPQQQGPVGESSGDEEGYQFDQRQMPMPLSASEVEEVPVTQPTPQESGDSQQQQQQSQPQILRNYESMNIKELQQEARNRNISGVSGMRRKELITALRNSDNDTVQRPTTSPTIVEELNAPQSSITDTAAEIVDSSLSPN